MSTHSTLHRGKGRVHKRKRGARRQRRSHAPSPIPTFAVALDAPSETRWQEVISVYRERIASVVQKIEAHVVGEWLASGRTCSSRLVHTILGAVMSAVESRFPYAKLSIPGCRRQSNTCLRVLFSTNLVNDAHSHDGVCCGGVGDADSKGRFERWHTGFACRCTK